VILSLGESAPNGEQIVRLVRGVKITSASSTIMVIAPHTRPTTKVGWSWAGCDHESIDHENVPNPKIKRVDDESVVGHDIPLTIVMVPVHRLYRCGLLERYTLHK